MKTKKIIIVGSGGHANSCLEILKQLEDFKIIGSVDNHKKFNSEIKYPLLGNNDDLIKIKKTADYAIIGIGQIKDFTPRVKIFKLLKKLDFKLPVIISKNAYVSNNAKISEGSIIMNHCLINTHVSIGQNCIINNKALIEHNSIIEDNCHISTGCIINGNVKIGKNTFIGSGSIINNNISVGKNCIISSGSIINKNISNNSLFVSKKK